ncbi:cytochrome P450 [Amycolatopsis sp. cg5]|uniref:cytochrome P450 n=1 Tax=Amycolatopsis sp. cg5 TaxID=3238802 RepID=UPI003525A2CA
MADLFASLFAPETRADPYPMYHQVRAKGEVLVLNENFVVVSGHDEATAVLRDPAFGHPEPEVLPDPDENEPVDADGKVVRSFLGLNPPDHTRLRRLVSKAFTPRTIERLAPRIETLARELVDAATEKGEADLMSEIAKPLPVIVISELLGVPLADRDRFAAWSNAMARALDPAFLVPDEVMREAVRARREFVAYFRQLAGERRRRPTEDLLSDLVAVSDSGDSLSEGELVITVMLLLIAGHETTTNLIGNGVLALLDHPEQLHALTTERSLAAQTVEEVLRYDSPVQLTMRTAMAPTAIGDVPVGQGAEVVILIGAANRDPRSHEDPDRFDLRRAPGRHLAFGQGIHFCLGAPLARLEAKTLLLALTERAHSFHQSALPTWSPTVTLRGPASLPLSFK